MFYSSVEIYCNNCGIKMFKPEPNIIGRSCKVCSQDCLNEYELKRAHSIMGAEYKGKECQK
jgi:hypothetical protein